MKFTLNWLKDHLDTSASLDDITTKLTALGLELDGVADRAAKLKAFVVAEVLEAKQHPNADRLRLCTVDTGSGTVQVVCGAPNARTGMKGVFAPIGSYIPGSDFTLKSTEIRGVASEGMLCSERELELSSEHEGIIELSPDAPVGMAYVDYAGLNDPVIDVAVTPNRPDCLGVRGIARDLAAAGLGTLKEDEQQAVPGQFASPVNVRIELPQGEEHVCPLFVGRFIRGLKNGQSPRWLQDRLRAIGLRPISALVDITNYLTFDRARPLHVYDALKLNGDVQVRLSRQGETLQALNGRQYNLPEGLCAIADSTGVLGLGGVMGGEDTGCTEETTDVFVESALFDPVRTAETGRRLGLESDARYRFERGVDPASAIPGMEFATRLILDICGGEASELVIAGAVPTARKTVAFRPSRLGTLGGLDFAEEEAERILAALGFTVEDRTRDSWTVAVPSWRPDIDGEADLVEEVLRVRGYDAIPAVPMERPEFPTGVMTPHQKRTRLVKRALATRGLRESVTWAFVSEKEAAMFGGADASLHLANPISSELAVMRPSLLPHLLSALGRNAARGFRDLGLFEVGNQYESDQPEGHLLVAAGVRGGASGERHWSDKPRPVSAFDAKADALAVLALAGAPLDNLQTVAEAPRWYHPGRSGVIKLGPKTVLARFGEIHPAVLAELDLSGPAAAFEVFLDAIPLPKSKGRRSRGPLKASDFQATERDFAFLVSREVAAEDLLRAAKGADKTLITQASLFDVYEGPGVGDDQKSVAISLRLQAGDRTLTDQEIEAVAAKVVEAVAKRTGAILRG